MPSAKQMIPPTVNRPWLVVLSSRANRTIAKPMSSSPATFSGRLSEPMKARMIAIPPRIPVTKFGLISS